MTTLPVQQGGSQNLGAVGNILQKIGLGGAGNTPQETNTGSLQNLAQIANLLQQGFNQPIETARVGNQNILVDREGPDFSGLAPTLATLAGQQKQKQQFEQRKKFMSSVEEIMGSNATKEDKVNNLMQLKTQHGTDYDIGIDDIVEQFNKQADRASKRTTQAAKDANKVSKVQQVLGEIETGGRDVQGINLEFQDENEARTHIKRKLGANAFTKHPELDAAIQKKYGADELGFREGQPHPTEKGYFYIGNNQWQKKK